MGSFTSGKTSDERFDKNVTISASAMCAVLFVSGFCWFFYYMCKRPNRTAFGTTSNVVHGLGTLGTVRKPSVSSFASVKKTDPNAQFYKAPTNPHVYLDRRASETPAFSRATTPTLPSQHEELAQYLSSFRRASQQEELQPPPPYPGRSEGQSEGFVYNVLTESGYDQRSYQHRPSNTNLPPPYSA